MTGIEITREFTYMVVCRTESKPKTETYDVRPKDLGLRLGRIQWYAPWRQYCFYPASQTIFSAGCLRDIKAFLDDVNEEHRRHLNESHKTS